MIEDSIKKELRKNNRIHVQRHGFTEHRSGLTSIPMMLTNLALNKQREIKLYFHQGSDKAKTLKVNTASTKRKQAHDKILHTQQEMKKSLILDFARSQKS